MPTASPPVNAGDPPRIPAHSLGTFQQVDLDGEGAEYAAGHCWLPDEIAPVIARIRESGVADGNGFKGPQPSELSDRDWRADPVDGMRPLRHIRLSYRGEAA